MNAPGRSRRRRASRTAQYVAFERAVLSRMGVVDDAFARTMLRPSLAVLDRVMGRGPRLLRSSSVLRAALATRTLWFDDQVRGALRDGVSQVAVIGAGYDSRAWRLECEDARFFEVDHPATQSAKIAVAPKHGPTYVPVDLSTEVAAAALCRGGLDPAARCLHVLEGVTMYLDEAAVLRQLRALAAVSSSGSRLAVNFTPPESVGTAVDRRLQRLIRLGRLGSGESFRLRVDLPDAVALVNAAGWRVTTATSFRDAARALVPPSAGLPVDAVSEHQSLIAAII